eukprot:COSAG04_NODE_1860_length_5374_cov_3.470142_5_plen_78_part_00
MPSVTHLWQLCGPNLQSQPSNVLDAPCGVHILELASPALRGHALLQQDMETTCFGAKIGERRVLRSASHDIGPISER